MGRSPGAQPAPIPRDRPRQGVRFHVATGVHFLVAISNPVFRMDARSRRLARPVDVENEVSRYSGGTGQKFCAEVLTTTRAES